VFGTLQLWQTAECLTPAVCRARDLLGLPVDQGLPVCLSSERYEYQHQFTDTEAGPCMD
jgi:hypothetical protein